MSKREGIKIVASSSFPAPGSVLLVEVPALETFPQRGPLGHVVGPMSCFSASPVALGTCEGFEAPPYRKKRQLAAKAHVAHSVPRELTYGLEEIFPSAPLCPIERFEAPPITEALVNTESAC